VSRWPDLIIIGAMKCATSTLHEQLALQPGIFMSEPKEPNFFSNDEEYRRGPSWYQGLFQTAQQNSLCGESSTHYTKLPTYPATIERMQKHLPATVKFIYVMRHPIDRLVSQYIHEWTQRLVDVPIDQAIDTLPILVDYSRYAMQLEPFIEAFGRERILPMFFERLTSNAQDELERTCRFIGYNGSPRWDESVGEQNASSQRLRKSGVRDAVINLPGLKWMRRTLVPQSMRDRVKGMWTMKQRPELSADNIARLTAIFDEDLARLGTWLGLNLTCVNFKKIARQSPPNWAPINRASVA